MIALQNDSGLSWEEITAALREDFMNRKPRKVLFIPPDITRIHSYAGEIMARYYQMCQEIHCQVDILPALGTHVPMSKEECEMMFGKQIPYSAFMEHRWRDDVVSIGKISAQFVSEISAGQFNEEIDVEVNTRIVDDTYDLIVSIGQVVPHEVVGMANYTKNIVVGCGGSKIIHTSHILGALHGMENLIGRDHSPVRKVFDYAEENFLQHLPIMYVLTVVTQTESGSKVCGLFAGRERKVFENAVAMSQKHNIIYLQRPQKKVVVFLDATKYRSTWLGNKAIYRTRMAVADEGELVIIAPGIKCFGEDPTNDILIRKYGYRSRKQVLELCESEETLRNNLAVAAHLIHGSSEGRFKVTYATQHLHVADLQQVGYHHLPLEKAQEMYDVTSLQEGENTLASGESIYFIDNPAKALWKYEE